MKQFTLTINSFKDIKLDPSNIELLKLLQQQGRKGIEVDSEVFDELCQNTINYCYEAIRASGELIGSNTRNNLSALIGDYLFKILLKNPFGEGLINSISENDGKKDEDREDLQLILKFGNGPDVVALAKCPWEYLHYSNEQDPKKGYFLVSKIKLHRVYDRPSSGFETLRKLKVVVFFSPIKGQYEKIHITEVEDIFKTLQNEFGDSYNDNKLEEGTFSYNYINAPNRDDESDPKTTYDNFFSKISQFKPDVIHFIGEARDKDNDQQLYFWEQNGLDVDAKGVDLSANFYPDFRKAIAQFGIKLFIFQTWNNFEDGAYMGFKNIAINLINENLPAVLSIPYSFKPRTSKQTIDKNNIIEFYKSLLENGASLSEAIFKLRNSLSRAGKGYPIVYTGGSDIDSFKVEVKDRSKKNPIPAGTSYPIHGGPGAMPTNEKDTPDSFSRGKADEYGKSTNPKQLNIDTLRGSITSRLNRIIEVEKKYPADNGSNLKAEREKVETNINSINENLVELLELGAKTEHNDSINSIEKKINDRITELFGEIGKIQDQKIGNDEDPKPDVDFIQINKINVYSSFLEKIKK